MLALALVLGGCNADVQDGIGPLTPFLNVAGVVKRIDADGKALKVKIRVPDLEDEVVIADTLTDDDGEFKFENLEPGQWEVKVSGDEVGDFHSITRDFSLADKTDFVALPLIDIWAYGTAVLLPKDLVSLPRPTPADPLVFRWSLPEEEVVWAQIQIYRGDTWVPVWSSDRVLAQEVPWEGIGNRGDFDGNLVPAGIYSWRLKVGLPGELQARVDRRRIFLR